MKAHKVEEVTGRGPVVMHFHMRRVIIRPD